MKPWGRGSEAANGDVLQIIFSARFWKLKLDRLVEELTNFAEHVNICQKGKRVKDFQNYSAEHITSNFCQET